MRFVSKVFAFPLYADATSPVGMVYENEFSPVGMSLLKGREFPRLRLEGVFFGARIGDDYEKNQVEHGGPAGKV